MLFKLKKNYFLIISTLLIFYFSINLLGGQRGLFSYIENKEILYKLKLQERDVKKKISELENVNSLLSENLDFDHIDILIRDKLMLGKKGEVTYIVNNDN
jgi:HD superfamily phosphohydrolase